jgi:hypothetical protein
VLHGSLLGAGAEAQAAREGETAAMTADQGRKCSERGCKEKHHALGLCRIHYQRSRRRGTLPPRQLEFELGVHSLTNVDRVARVADCSACGPQVRIRVRIRSGNYKTACWSKDKARRKPWRPQPAEYNRMFADQGGRCAICQAELPQLVVDHDHATGLVRGLLCANCNCGIGFLRDDISILHSAARYLAAHSAKAPLLQSGEAAPLSA